MKKRRYKLVFLILAIFLGNFGIHQLYIRNYKKAVLYFLFSWTYIPYALSIFDIININKLFRKIDKVIISNNDLNNKLISQVQIKSNIIELDNIEKDKFDNKVSFKYNNQDKEQLEIESFCISLSDGDTIKMVEEIKHNDKLKGSNDKKINEEKQIIIKRICEILMSVSESRKLEEGRNEKQLLIQELLSVFRYILLNKELNENANLQFGVNNCNDQNEEQLDVETLCTSLSDKKIVEKEEEIKYDDEKLKKIDNNKTREEKQALIERVCSILINLVGDKKLEEIKNNKEKQLLLQKLCTVFTQINLKKELDKEGNLYSEEKVEINRELSKKSEKDTFNGINKFIFNKKKDKKEKSKSKINPKKFYDEDNIILEKYKHLLTPQYIINSVNYHKEKSDSINFIKESVKSSNLTGKKCEFEPLMAYWTTFNSLSNRQKAWYFYWRGCVLRGNYIDTDLSYIILFVYELLNYSFNSSAAFNISMLERLSEAYCDRHRKLEKYIKPWINDFLKELGELNINEEEYFFEDKMYKTIKNYRDNVDKISITCWKVYINYNPTKFFENNKNKIYNTFKQNILILSNFYNENGTSLLSQWYKERTINNNIRLYKSAVIIRDVENIDIKQTFHKPNAKMYQQLTQMFRFSENIVREQAGEKRRIKLETQQLPNGFIDYYNCNREDNKAQEELKNRFKKVKVEYDDISATIPKRVKNSEIDSRNKILKMEFDEEVISSIGKEGEELIEIFNEIYENDYNKVENLTYSKIISQINTEKNLNDNIYENEIINKSNTISGLNYMKIQFNQALISDMNKESEDLANIFIEKFNDNSKGEENEELPIQIETHDYKEENDFFIEQDIHEDIDGFIKSLDSIEIRFINKFEALSMNNKDANIFSKENGKMLSLFIDEINSKSVKFLGDVFIEIEGDNYIIYEEYDSVMNKIRRFNQGEN